MTRLHLSLVISLFAAFLVAGGEDIKVAVISFSPPGPAPVDVSQNTILQYRKNTADSLERYIQEAAEEGAKLVVTPEFGTVGYPDFPELPPEEDEFQNRDQIRPYVETLSGPTVNRFGKLAAKLKIWLVIGIAEGESKAGSPGVDQAGKFYNTLVAFNPLGNVVQTYRKIHLYAGERSFLSPGSERKYFDTDFGRVGLFTCYDIHFANPATDLVRKDKAKIIAFGTSWVGDDGMSTFRNFAESNRVYLLAANHTYFPDSGVISPDGTIQGQTKGSGPVYGFIRR